MKKIIAIFALVCVAAAAGCSNGNSATETSATTAASNESDGNSLKQTIDMSEEDLMAESTDKALDYLDENAPLFGKYIRQRRNIPLSFETEVTMDGLLWKTKLFIKDEYTLAQVSESPDGKITKVVYKDGLGYQIDYTNKSVYVQNDLSKAEIKLMIDSQRMMNLSYDEISASEYVTDTAEYDGVEYDRVTVTEPSSGVSASHYYDKSTGKVAFMMSDTYVSKIVTFENAITDESVFDIPADFENKTFDDLVDEYNAENPEAAE